MLTESSFVDLCDSTVRAFPNCRFRQHATQPVKISQIAWTPFIGMKTLFVKAIAQNEGKEYNLIILFKGVRYQNINENAVTIKANDGKNYFLKQLSTNTNDILIRCSCKDHMFRFNYYNYLDHSLHGRKRKKYEGQGLWKANPLKLPGLCKHLIKFMEVLSNSKIIK